MTHQPQEVLIKVMCSECAGSGHSPKYEVTDIDPVGGEIYSEVDAECNSCQATGFTYEPVTRIVLTVEEYFIIQEKLRIADEIVLEINKLKTLNPPTK